MVQNTKSDSLNPQNTTAPPADRAAQASDGCGEMPLPLSPTPAPNAPHRRHGSWKLVCALFAIALCVVAGAASYQKAAAHYQQAEQYLAVQDFQRAAVELVRVPSVYKEQALLARLVELCLLAENGTKADCNQALNGLAELRSTDSAVWHDFIEAQYHTVSQQYRDLLFEAALHCLTSQQYAKALEYLRKIPEHPYAAELLCFTLAKVNTDFHDTSYHLQTVLTSMEQIPAEYDGPLAVEMATFKEELLQRIAATEILEQQARDETAEARKKAEAERIAAAKATGLPYTGMAEGEVNSTRQLGKGYRTTTENGWNVYSWYSKETGSLVFQAKCSDGTVFSAEKYGDASCWAGSTLLVELGPQMTPGFHFGGSSSDERHDPSIRDAYDNPEDLYEENRDWFDDEEEAWDYWYED